MQGVSDAVKNIFLLISKYLEKWDTKIVNMMDYLRAILLVTEIGMMEPKTLIAGVHVILNLKGMSLHHIYQVSPFTAKLITDLVQVKF